MSTLKADYIQSTNPSLPVDIGGSYSPTFNGNKILCGVTGSLTATSGQSYVVVIDAAATVNSKLFLHPKNTAAATFLGSRYLVVTSKSAGSIRADVSDNSNFSGSEQFDYILVQPPV